MTCARSRTKSGWSNSLALLLVLAVLFTAASAIAAPEPTPAPAPPEGIKQYQREFRVGGRVPAAILIVGWEKDAKDVERLMDIVSAKANESLARLDWRNAESDVGRINAQAGKGPVKVSEDVVAAIEAAQKVANWTGGAFDVVGGAGSYRDIAVNEGAQTVELKKAGMQLNLDPIADGFLAELMLRYIFAASMQNAMVKVGNTFRGIGTAIMGPWRIQVQDDSGTFAHHALNLTVANTAIATVSADQYREHPLIDPRSKATVAPPCRGVTLVMNDAALAQGLAQALFLLGPDKGMKLLAKLGNAKALIVDAEGKFIRSPGF
jgi:FAD:protein FMN transferase